MSCRHAKKEIKSIRRLLADLGDRDGDEPVLVFARDLRAVLVMLAALDGTKRSGASLIGETARTLRPLARFPRHFPAFA